MKPRTKPKRGPMTIAVVTDEAVGALRNGTRVQKTKDVPGDLHRIGAQGVIRGSIRHDEHPEKFGYFVTWDDAPSVPVFVTAGRIAPLD